jgi:hypothetical protein
MRFAAPKRAGSIRVNLIDLRNDLRSVSVSVPLNGNETATQKRDKIRAALVAANPAGSPYTFNNLGADGIQVANLPAGNPGIVMSAFPQRTGEMPDILRFGGTDPSCPAHSARIGFTTSGSLYSLMDEFSQPAVFTAGLIYNDGITDLMYTATVAGDDPIFASASSATDTQIASLLHGRLASQVPSSQATFGYNPGSSFFDVFVQCEPSGMMPFGLTFGTTGLTPDSESGMFGTLSVAAAPEPGTLSLGVVGIVALTAGRRVRRGSRPR